jgi:hypothetical protein
MMEMELPINKILIVSVYQALILMLQLSLKRSSQTLLENFSFLLPIVHHHLAVQLHHLQDQESQKYVATV